MNRYKITVDRDSFREFWSTRKWGYGLTYIPQPEDSLDYVILGIRSHETDEDETVRFLREYSAWLSTKD